MEYVYLESPIGKLLVASEAEALRLIRFPSGPKGLAGAASGEPRPDWEQASARRGGPISELTQQLKAYFAGSLRQFELPLAPQGSDFRRAVWRALQTIPYGETVSYGVLAERIGRPGAARAVGSANGSNPLPIVIPCHRVIASNGRLAGFGGGLETKQWLLEHEGALAGEVGRG